MDSYLKESNKLNVLNSNIPKLMTPARSRGNYYASPENLIKPLRSNSLSSSGNNSSSGKSSFRSPVLLQSEKTTPAKVVEKNVLVMDGVLVASDSDIEGSSSSSSPGSVGFYKSEICRTWEEFGHCQYGLKCQFAHGKEEVRPSCFSFGSKSEAQIYKSYASTHGLISCPSHRETATIIAQKESSIRPEYTSRRTNAPMKPENTHLTTDIAIKTKTAKALTSRTRPYISATNRTYWSPQDDGIDATLLSSLVKIPSIGDINAYIDSVLYGPATRTRLPEFSAFCPQ